MTLRFDARLASRGFDVALEVADGETVAVLGPNGAGKSTLVELLAGLVRPDAGSARLGDSVLFGPGAWTPPHRRGVALLAQDPLLFPHLSVRENAAFGPRSAGVGRAQARARAERRLADVDALPLADRRPGTLSGGQAQRVALARALATDPRLLLLDEPMAALDVRVAPVLRRMLRTVLADRTTILVTHDVLDAWTLADRVVVLHEGRVVEDGPTAEVLERPRTAFTAELSGLRLVRGVRTAVGLRLEDGREIAGVSDAVVGSAVAAAVRPSAVTLGEGGLREEIVDLEPRGDAVRVHGRVLAADLTPAEAARRELAPGVEVGFVLEPVELYAV